MTTIAAKIPTITATSTINFYDVLSSDGKTHYPMLIEGYGRVSCGCPGGTTLYDAKGNIVKQARNCYHRQWALENIAYIDEDAFNGLAQLEIDLHQWRVEMGWLETLEKVEAIAELDEVEELFSEAA